MTRPEPDATAFAAQVEAAGFEPVLSPVMAIRMRAASPDLDGVGALAFTSANGARALRGAVEAPPMLPVFAVGAITAETALAQGFSNVASANGDVESLALLISEASEAGLYFGDILHCAGSSRAGGLVDALAAGGITARLAVLYDAIPAATLAEPAMNVLTQDRQDDCTALFSPRSARLFIDQVHAAGLMEHLKRLTALCLSDAVAKEAGAAEWRDIRVAPERSADSLLAVISKPKPTPHS